MRKRDFALPNFTATIRFVGGDADIEFLVYGANGPAVETRLKLRYPGIQVKSVDPYDFADKWEAKAKLRRLAVDASIKTKGKEKYDFNKNNIWTELKDFLFDLYDGNCAYCECDLLGGSFGAVEHYRPKNPVLGVAGHPGYYWLAYEVTNYLPTCTRCNTAKANFFPLAEGSPRATSPGDEAHELPLLLNPYLDVPTTHLAFIAAGSDTQAGPVAKGLTEHGKESVRLLNLNRPDVLTDRFRQQNLAVQQYITQRLVGIRPNPVLEQLKAGTRPFSAAALVAVTSIEQGFPSLGG